MTETRKTLLIEAARNGDVRALEQMLYVCQPDIHRYARRSCAHSNDVDDAVQESLWMMYQKLGTLRASAAFPRWLFQIVKRICLRLAWRGWREDQPLESIESNVLFATISQDDLRLDLASAIEALPRQYRQIILLRDCEQLTIAEIATALNISNEAVKSRVHRGRTMIREYLYCVN